MEEAKKIRKRLKKGTIRRGRHRTEMRRRIKDPETQAQKVMSQMMKKREQ